MSQFPIHPSMSMTNNNVDQMRPWMKSIRLNGGAMQKQISDERLTKNPIKKH